VKLVHKIVIVAAADSATHKCLLKGVDRVGSIVHNS